MNKKIIVKRSYKAQKIHEKPHLVAIIWREIGCWMVFKEIRPGYVKCTKDRGTKFKRDSNLWLGQKIYEEMRSKALQYFAQQQRAAKKAWVEFYAYPDKKPLPPPWQYFKQSADSPKMKRGLSSEKLPPDFFTDQTTLEEVNLALSHKGPRKTDNKLNDPNRFKQQRPKNVSPGKKEEKGQRRLF